MFFKTFIQVKCFFKLCAIWLNWISAQRRNLLPPFKKPLHLRKNNLSETEDMLCTLSPTSVMSTVLKPLTLGIRRFANCLVKSIFGNLKKKNHPLRLPQPHHHQCSPTPRLSWAILANIRGGDRFQAPEMIQIQQHFCSTDILAMSF